MEDIRLRDKRKPGHCWQDNELYDAFGPVIGANVVLVYVHMTRHCYGTEIRCSSRELAAASGLSKDTICRAIRAMERIGMLRCAGGGMRRAGEYHLVDLKDLAIRHGGRYDPPVASYVFSAEQIAALRAIATATPGAAQSVAVRDRSAEQSVAVGDSAATELSQQRDTSVAAEGHASFNYSKQQNNQENPTPTPSLAREGVCDLDRGSLEQQIAEIEIRLKGIQRNTAEYFATAGELIRLRKHVVPNDAARPAAPQEAMKPQQLVVWPMSACGLYERNANRPRLMQVLERVIAGGNTDPRREVSARRKA